MGQYYRPVIENSNGNMVAIDTYLNGEYECAKLMEQSWYTPIHKRSCISTLQQ